MNSPRLDRQNTHLDLNDPEVQAVIERYQDYDEVPYISPKRPLKEWLDKVSDGRETLVPKRHMVRYEEDILPGYLILLWRIGFGTFRNDSIYPKYFEYNYGINGQQALEELLEKGYARELSANESLTYLSAAQLKSRLKAEKISGYSSLNKDQLMTLVRSHFDEAALQDFFTLRGNELTESGQALLDRYPEVVDRHPKKNY